MYHDVTVPGHPNHVAFRHTDSMDAYIRYGGSRNTVGFDQFQPEDWFSFKMILQSDGTIYISNNYYGMDYGIGYDASTDELKLVPATDIRLVYWICTTTTIDPALLN